MEGAGSDVSSFISDLYSQISAGLTVTFDGNDYTTMGQLFVDNEVINFCFFLYRYS